MGGKRLTFKNATIFPVFVFVPILGGGRWLLKYAVGGGHISILENPQRVTKPGSFSLTH